MTDKEIEETVTLNFDAATLCELIESRYNASHGKKLRVIEMQGFPDGHRFSFSAEPS